jgi:hypothetical protein
MDFTRLDASRFDERLRALADLRKRYLALRRGAQRTLFAPGDACRPPSSSLDPAADFGDRLFVRGSFDSWASPPPESQRLVNLGSRQYQAAVSLAAGAHQFKIAAADWTPEFSNPQQAATPGTPVTLSTLPGENTNSRLSVTAPGCYAFELNAASLANPVLTVTGPTSSAVDPDVLALARTLAGERSVVVVGNNQRSAVDLGTLPGGGIAVEGLLAEGVASDLTGTGTSLTVSGGRLRGTLPALTAVAL